MPAVALFTHENKYTVARRGMTVTATKKSTAFWTKTQ